MKGFPNQINKLDKLANGMQVLLRLVGAHSNARDDAIFGEALVRAGVAGPRDKSISKDKYIRQQRTKRRSDRGYEATARGLLELYERLGFIHDSGSEVSVTDLGRQAASYAGAPMDAEQLDFWRRAIRSMAHDGGGEISHPYQVLLRLVGRKPGILRAKCALALEAHNDSPEELDRIVALADLPEDQILHRIGEKESNWDNAKKVLPAFAIQLRDIIQAGQSFVLADAPGRAVEGTAEQTIARPVARASRTSREVTPDTIAQAGTADRPDEFEIPPEIDPEAVAEANRLRLDRLRRHNLIVQELAARLGESGVRLYEDPFDILALIEERAILTEVKTLDGTDADERDRVRAALSQLLYYEAFATVPIAGEAVVHKVACFERPISEAHRDWLNRSGIAVIWKDNGGFAGDELAAGILGDYIQELR